MYQKGRISLKIQMRRFQEIKDFGLGRLPTRATITLQEVEVLPTLNYFHFKDCLTLVFGLRGLVWLNIS